MTDTVKSSENDIPKAIKTKNNVTINDVDLIIDEYIDFFVNVCKNLAEKIDQSSTNFNFKKF